LESYVLAPEDDQHFTDLVNNVSRLFPDLDMDVIAEVCNEAEGDAKLAVQTLLDRHAAPPEDGIGGGGSGGAVTALGAELDVVAAGGSSTGFGAVSEAAAAAAHANAADALAAELDAASTAAASASLITSGSGSGGGGGGGGGDETAVHSIKKRRASNVKSKNFNRMSMAVLEHQLALVAASGKWADRDDVKASGK